MRDLEADTTTLVSRAPDGSPADGDSGDPSISAKARRGRVRVPCDQPQRSRPRCVHRRVHLRPGRPATTTLISRHGPHRRAGGDGSSFDPSISDDGARLAFVSDADNLFADDRDLFHNVYVSHSAGVHASHHVSPDLHDRVCRPPGRTATRTSPVISASDGGWQARRLRLRGDQPGRAAWACSQVFRPQFVREQHRPRQPRRRVAGAMGLATRRRRRRSRRTAAWSHSRPRRPTSAGRQPERRRTAARAGSDVFVRDMAWDNTS